MKKKPIAAIISGLFIALSLHAQNTRINAGWEFQRLNEKQRQVEIKNQGSDWSSQFNIQHVEAQNKALAIHPDTLRMEFGQLSSAAWERVGLPHTPFVEPLVVLQQWQGVCYYRKQLNIHKKDRDKQLWLEFEGAMHLADVWVNGKHLMQHSGGYTPFIVDVTGMLHADRANEILVRLDNRNNPLIPPGKPLETLDFCYYGGLYRDVNLIVNEPVHITHPIMADEVAGGGIFVTYPKVSEQEAEVNVKTQVQIRLPDGKISLYAIRFMNGARKRDAIRKWFQWKAGSLWQVVSPHIVYSSSRWLLLNCGFRISPPSMCYVQRCWTEKR